MTDLSRRRFNLGCSACATLALVGCATDGVGTGQMTPGYRPSAATDEGGLWGIMDRAEAEVKRSRFLIRDPNLNGYVRDIACRLGADHCGDVRIYITRTPFFNASMAPNGMMTIWTGLLLRAHNEAQLAAIIGHEMGHYLNRHTLQQWRNTRNTADFAAFLGVGLAGVGAGLIGTMAQIAAIASIYAYSREQEREADDVGFTLMTKAGYRPMEAARVWEQQIAESEASDRPRNQDVFFATHPAPEERFETLRKKAKAQVVAPTETYQARYLERLRGIRRALLEDELRQRQYAQTLKVFEMLAADGQADAELIFFTGEVYRLRNDQGDDAKAIKYYEQALLAGDAPAETHRGLGLVHMRGKDQVAAEKAFRRYLELKPDAEDRAVIRSYVRIQS